MFEKFSISSPPDKSKRDFLKAAGAGAAAAVASQFIPKQTAEAGIDGPLETQEQKERRQMLDLRTEQALARPKNERIMQTAGMHISAVHKESQGEFISRGLCGLVELQQEDGSSELYFALTQHCLADCDGEAVITLPAMGEVRIPVNCFYTYNENGELASFEPSEPWELASEKILLAPAWGRGQDLNDALNTHELEPLEVLQRVVRERLVHNGDPVLLIATPLGSQPISPDLNTSLSGRDHIYGSLSPNSFTRGVNTIAVNINNTVAKGEAPNIICQGPSGGVVYLEGTNFALGVFKGVGSDFKLSADYGNAQGTICTTNEVHITPFP